MRLKFTWNVHKINLHLRFNSDLNLIDVCATQSWFFVDNCCSSSLYFFGHFLSYDLQFWLSSFGILDLQFWLSSFGILELQFWLPSFGILDLQFWLPSFWYLQTFLNLERAINAHCWVRPVREMFPFFCLYFCLYSFGNYVVCPSICAF